MQSVSDKILTRIHRQGRGYVFSAKDFLDQASRASVDKALSTLNRLGQIRRVRRGIYDYPRVNLDLGGQLSLDYHQVAHAIARNNAVRIEASDAWSANLLGLSTQVPGRIVYLTNGTSRTYRVGRQLIAFRRVGPKQLRAKSGVSNLVVQALRHLGRNGVDQAVIDHLRYRRPAHCMTTMRPSPAPTRWLWPY